MGCPLIWIDDICWCPYWYDWLPGNDNEELTNRHPFPSLLASRTLPRTSRRNSTRNTTRHGIASWAATLDHTWRTRPATLSTSTWVRWPSCCSRAVKRWYAIGEQRRMSRSVQAAATWCNLRKIIVFYVILEKCNIRHPHTRKHKNTWSNHFQL